MSYLSIDNWLQKSSCWLSNLAMQQPWLLNGQTGEHLLHNPVRSKPHSSSTNLRPFGFPSFVIFCGRPCFKGPGLDCGIIVSCCLCCFPPLDLFMLNACNVSGGSVACVEELSKIDSTWIPGLLISLWIWIANCTWLSRSSCVHHASPLAPGKIIFCASLTTFPSVSHEISWPSSSLIKSETWIIWPLPFFCKMCSPWWSLQQTQ